MRPQAAGQQKSQNQDKKSHGRYPVRELIKRRHPVLVPALQTLLSFAERPQFTRPGFAGHAQAVGAKAGAGASPCPAASPDF